jgi:bifunctional UDP-N-acetylglucosamine pyrophosphorylase/glucosamine-1-phosphate N-acetyltransferase
VRNKAAFPIANVAIVRRMADTLIELGIERIVVVVGAGEASVRAAMRGCNAEIVYVRQPEPGGTAAAVLLGACDVEGDFLVVAGDVVSARENLVAVLDCFVEHRPLAVALTQPLGDESPRDWIVAHHEGDYLSGVEGHARGGSHRLCHVYAFRSEAMAYLRDNPGIMTHVPVGGMPPLETEIAQSLQQMIDEGERPLALTATGYYVDLDKPWHILEANHAVIDDLSASLSGDVVAGSAQIHDGAEIQGQVVAGEHAVIGNRVVVGGDVWLGKGARLENGAILEGSVVVGPGTVVKNYCQIGGHSALGARGVYGHGAEFSGVALDSVYCYHYCEIWGVVGQSVDFGAATVCGNLRFDDADTVWRIKGRSEVPTHAANAAYFGDFCRTGVNAIVMPGRRIGVYSCVGPGVVVYEDVPDRQLVLVEQNTETRPWGPERYGW